MAKTKALTWQSIFDNDKICSLAKAHDIPIEELVQRTHNDKVLPRLSIEYFFKKALCHREIAHVAHSQFKNVFDIFDNGKIYYIQSMGFYQSIYEQIGFANEFLFKGLVTVEYKAFPKEHTIRELYDILEDEEIKNLISANAIRFQWDSIEAYIDFIDSIVPSGRRYFSYEFCSTFEDFIANRFSQSFPITDHQKVGVESLLELFMKIYVPAEKKASRMYNAWNAIIEELKIMYPKRFERLNQQWSK